MVNGLLGAVLFGLAVALPAQQGNVARQPHPGRVVDPDGKPVVGAEVLFASQAMAWGTEAEDVVQGVSDVAGRYRVLLLPNRSYVAWAKRTDAAGTFVTPPIARAALATELRFEPDAQPAPIRCRVQGLEAWRPYGPLRVQLVVAGCSSLVPSFVVPDDGTVAVPPLPGAGVGVWWFAKEQLVHAGGADLRRPWQLPPPWSLPARVYDEHGKPLAGALVERLWSFRRTSRGPFPQAPEIVRLPMATSDADGAVELLVAATHDPRHGGLTEPLVFFASKPGHRESVSGFGEVLFSDASTMPALGRPYGLDFTLPESVAAPFRLIGGPAPRHVAFLAKHMLPISRRNDRSITDLVVCSVADAGTCLLPPTKTGVRRLVALQVPGVIAPLAENDPFRRVSSPRTLLLPAACIDADEGQVDLRRVVPLRLQLLDGSGGPAASAHVLCSPAIADGYLGPESVPHLESDSAGRLVVPVLPGTWLVVAVHEELWACVKIEVDDAPEVQTVSLQPFARSPVRVVDAAGVPVVGARFSIRAFSSVPRVSPEQGFVSDLIDELMNWSVRRIATGTDGRAVVCHLGTEFGEFSVAALCGKLTTESLSLRDSAAERELVLR